TVVVLRRLRDDAEASVSELRQIAGQSKQRLAIVGPDAGPMGRPPVNKGVDAQDVVVAKQRQQLGMMNLADPDQRIDAQPKQLRGLLQSLLEPIFGAGQQQRVAAQSQFALEGLDRASEVAMGEGREDGADGVSALGRERARAAVGDPSEM